MLCAQAWKPSSQHAGEKRGVAGLLLEVTPECSWEAEQGLERRQGWKEVGTWGDGDAHGTGRERRGAVAGPLSSASILRKKEL